MVKCGCKCICHEYEDEGAWPGPCAGCCEPGDMCKCGIALAKLGLQRSIYATIFTDPEYAKKFDEAEKELEAGGGVLYEVKDGELVEVNNDERTTG